MTKQELLNKISNINQKALDAKNDQSQLREQLALAIREASNAGITYKEIGKTIGKSKTGVAMILSRSSK